MKVTEKQITQITITGAERPEGKGSLDSIRVMLEDTSPGQGRITIEVFGEAWSHYWPGMGDNSIAEFFVKANIPYLSNKLRRPDEKFTELDGDKIIADMKRAILSDRRERQIEDHEARSLWDQVEWFCLDEWDINHIGREEAELLEKTLGVDWYEGLSERTSPHGEWVNDILAAVQAVLADRVSKAAA